MLDILLRHLLAMPSDEGGSGTLTTQMMDAGDDSGDTMLELPDELPASVGWKEGDVLIASICEAGELWKAR
jgi:hypothetical protein